MTFRSGSPSALASMVNFSERTHPGSPFSHWTSPMRAAWLVSGVPFKTYAVLISRSTVPHSNMKRPGEDMGNPPWLDRCPGGVGGSFTQGLIEMTSNFGVSAVAGDCALATIRSVDIAVTRTATIAHAIATDAGRARPRG